MDKKTQWAKHIRAQEKSGKSVATYCREARLREKAFYYWRRRMQGGFIQIAGAEPAKLELEFKNGLIIKVAADIETSALKRLVEVLNA